MESYHIYSFVPCCCFLLSITPVTSIFLLVVAVHSFSLLCCIASCEYTTLYPFNCWWTIGLFLAFGCYISCCQKKSNMCVLLNIVSIMFFRFFRSINGGSWGTCAHSALVGSASQSSHWSYLCKQLVFPILFFILSCFYISCLQSCLEFSLCFIMNS